MTKKRRFNLPSKGYNLRFESIKNISGLVAAFDYRFGVYTDTAMTTRAVVGDFVRGWDGRFGYNATEATNPPTLQADGLSFDGVNDVLRVARMTGQFDNGLSYVVVVSIADAESAATQTVFGGQNSSPVNALFNYRVATTGQVAPRITENSVTINVELANFPDGLTPYFIGSIVANPSGNMNGFYNGTQVGGTPALSGLNWANLMEADAETIALGALMSNATTVGSFCACTIQHLLIWSRPLTNNELIQIHRYLGKLSGIAVP